MSSIAALLQAAEYLERRERGKGPPFIIQFHLRKFDGESLFFPTLFWRVILKEVDPTRKVFIFFFKIFAEVEHGYASIPGPFVLDPDSSYTQISNHKLASNAANPGLNPNYRRLTNKPNNRKPQGNR